jgi:hypothetical protein
MVTEALTSWENGLHLAKFPRIHRGRIVNVGI